MYYVKSLPFLLLVLFVIAVSPFVSIWALNTLFGLQIENNFFTWAAMAWLHGIVAGVGLKLS